MKNEQHIKMFEVQLGKIYRLKNRALEGKYINFLVPTKVMDLERNPEVYYHIECMQDPKRITQISTKILLDMYEVADGSD